MESVTTVSEAAKKLLDSVLSAANCSEFADIQGLTPGISKTLKADAASLVKDAKILAKKTEEDGDRAADRIRLAALKDQQKLGWEKVKVHWIIG